LRRPIVDEAELSSSPKPSESTAIVEVIVVRPNEITPHYPQE
jgi:hypothetical protein